METTERQQQVINAGLQIADEYGIAGVTLPRLAKQSGLSHPLISYHCGCIADIRITVAKAAAKADKIKIVMQAVANELINFADLPAAIQQKIRNELK